MKMKEKWVKKVIKCHMAKDIISEYISENEYEKVMEELLTELIDLLIEDDGSKKDAELISRKESIRFYGVKDSDVFATLKDAVE